jgi:tRNA (cytidine/uridine-2'-O-)-methyltransferase
MAIALALYQPDIAQNTGTLLRLGACLDVAIHVIHPAGFALSRQTLRRSGLDYLDWAHMVEHDSFARFDAWRRENGKRLVLLTTKTERSAYRLDFRPDDILMVGRESAGVPDAVAAIADEKIRIPMRQGMRSINVALAATLIVGEAKRQTRGFEDLA